MTMKLLSLITVLVVTPTISLMADVLQPGSLLPECQLPNLLNGKLTELSKAQKGKKTVLHVFASW